MTLTRADIVEFVDARDACVLVRVSRAQGSVPREAGTWMLVASGQIMGTIGGGQLEFLAIDHSRKILKGDLVTLQLDIPLGPDIGQCCGGRVVLDFAPLDDETLQILVAEVDASAAAQTHFYVFGAGHIGKALALSLAQLPFTVTVVDTRQDQLDGVDARATRKLSPMPESYVRSAPRGAIFVAVTHDHALDFMITREALLRGDARYVGMIGSKTKRAQFKRWFLSEGGNVALLGELVCPIGAGITDDKRPEIIAVLTAAEIVGAASHSDRPSISLAKEKTLQRGN